MAKLPSEKAISAIGKMRLLLGEWLRTSKESREPVAQMLEHLEIVDQYIHGEGSIKSENSTVGAKRSSAASYTVEKHRSGDEVLMEHRAGGRSNPFRCPKYLYDAVINVLVATEPSVDFEALMEGVKQLRFEPAEFQLRAAIRFLLSRKPTVLVRDRNRYRPLRRQKFEGEAKAAWIALAKQSK